MDIVFIEDLRIEAIVGIFDWEREVRQELIVNVEMSSDTRRAAASENISDALNYAAVSQRVREFIISSQFQLLETLAEQTADMVMHEFDVPWVKIRCKKTQVMKDTAGVGVEIVRGRQPIHSTRGIGSHA